MPLQDLGEFLFQVDKDARARDPNVLKGVIPAECHPKIQTSRTNKIRRIVE